MKSKVAAAVLAILFGGIGVHKFYLGRTGAGVLYLLFCWTFIPAVVGFVEGIIYLFMSDDEFNQKYNTKWAPAQSQPQNIVVNVENKAVTGNEDKKQEKDISAAISDLHKLLESGALTQEEFDAQKAKLLGAGTV